MTLQTFKQFVAPVHVPEAAMSQDQRAVALGKLVKEKRLDLGLNRPAFVREMARHGEDITPDYLNKLESGAASLARASLQVREGIRIVLGYSSGEWQELTGLYTAVSASTEMREDQTPLQKLKRPISDTLKEAASIYGARFPDLADPLWQDYLESFRPRGVRADTPEAWLDLYRDLAKHGITPGGN